MKFESMRAWDEGVAMVRGNSAVALPIAGVFFVLPALILNLFAPTPAIDQSMSPEQQMSALVAGMQAALPYMLLTLIVQQAGVLALLTLFTDRSRPTVGQAIGRGFAALPTYLGAMVLLMIAGGLAASLVAIVAGLALRVAALVVALMAGLSVLLIYLTARTWLIAPAIAIEQQRNPLQAIVRSWILTRGNVGRLLVFYLLMLLAYGLITAAAVGVTGLILTLLAGQHAGQIAASVVQSFLGAVFVTLQAGIFAAIHRQLAGPSDESLRSTFD